MDVLRQRRGAPRAGRHAGDRAARETGVWSPRRPTRRAARGARRDADRPRAAAVPDRDRPAGRHGALHRGVPVGDGAVPLGHPAGRAAVAGRGLPRRQGRRARARRRRGDRRVPARLGDEQGITCSVGVAPTKFVAKLASTRASPTGCSWSGRARSSTSCTRCRSGPLWGSVRRRGDPPCATACAPSATRARAARTLQRAGRCERAGSHLHELAWGRDPRRRGARRDRALDGGGGTFGTDVDDPRVIHRELLLLSERTAVPRRERHPRPHRDDRQVRPPISPRSPAVAPRRAHRRRAGVGDTACALFDALGLDRARIRLGRRAERLVDAATAFAS